MILTPLEATCIAIILSLVSAVAVRLLFSRSFVTRTECSAQQEKLCLEKKALQAHLESLENGQRLQFRMLRGLVVHSAIPADKQEDILNGN